MNRLKHQFTCSVCQKQGMSQQPNKKICGKDCWKKFYNRVGKLGIAAGSVGAISEMEVCSFLLKSGYGVFKAVSPSCFCDVVAVKGNEIMLVEVRTGYKDLNSKITFRRNLNTGISLPTHYGIYIQESDEVVIRKISVEELERFSQSPVDEF